MPFQLTSDKIYLNDFITLLSEGYINLNMSDIVPGEPIRFSWSFRSFGKLDEEKTVNLTVQIDGHKVIERQGLELSQIRDKTTNETVIPSQSLENLIYKIGRHTLKLELYDARSLSAWRYYNKRFHVVPERFDPGWWQWRGEVFKSIEWKKGYALIGDFTNRSRFASISHVTAELSEVRSENNPQINPCDYLPIQTPTIKQNIAPNASVTFQFNLKHEWSWFFPAAYIFKGPINKTFAYSVYFYFHDQFGNAYNAQCSARRHRHIGVSKAKKLAFAGAQSAALAAAAAGPFAFVYAGVMYGIASGLALIAKDPPEPDFDFNEKVSLSYPIEYDLVDRLPDETSNTHSFIRILLEVIALENQRTDVRSRLLAARMMENKDGIELQSSEYMRIEDDMRRRAEAIRSSWQEAEETHRSQYQNRKSDVAYDSIAEEGFRSSQVDDALDFGLTHEHIDGLTAIIRNPEVRRAVSGDLDVIRTLAYAVIYMIDEFLSESENILSGEKYIKANSRDALEMGDAESSPSTSGKKCC